MAFDPNDAGTRFFINDAGQSTWEEIDEGIAGAHYGWNVREGHCVRTSTVNSGPPPADGLSIDQIVLSPERWLMAAPGLPRNDATIVPG